MHRNAPTREKDHEGTFAVGLETERHHPESEPVRRFSAGLERGIRTPADEHEGSFSEGLEQLPHNPELEPKRRFSEGQEGQADAPEAPLRARRGQGT